MSDYTSDERWELEAPTHVRSIVVYDLGPDAQESREAKVKAGARVVPFGFARVLDPPKPVEPLLWEGDGG